MVLVALVVLVLLLLVIKGATTSTSSEAFEPTIPLSEVEGLSDIEITTKLFVGFMEHYKASNIFDDKKIVEYKDINIRPVTGLPGYESYYHAGYSVKQAFWNSYWDAGNGKIAPDGWKLNKSNYVELIKENGQARMKLRGTGL